MNFYKHFIGDYARGTGDLPIIEHGAYRLMLDHFYGTGRPLPADKRALYRLLRAETSAEKRAIDNVCQRFWRLLPDDLATVFSWLALDSNEEQQAFNSVARDWPGGGLINARALREIVKAQVQAQKNRQIAIAREQNRREAKKGEQE